MLEQRIGEGDRECVAGREGCCFSSVFLKDTDVLFHAGCYPRLENTIPLTTPPAPGENCVQQLYRCAATVANEQQDYHSDPRCY